MKIKTEGRCIGCGEKYQATKGSSHILKCTEISKSLRSHAKLEKGYLVRVSWAGQSNMYWMLIANEAPLLLCEKCKKPAQDICSFCGETICSGCSKRHPCVIQEKDTYMLMPLVNSPRAGVCGYTGKT